MLAKQASVAAAQEAAPTQARAAPSVQAGKAGRPGSDFMVDVFKSLGIEYMFAIPRIELPGPARIDHQLRRQQESRG